MYDTMHRFLIRHENTSPGGSSSNRFEASRSHRLRCRLTWTVATKVSAAGMAGESFGYRHAHSLHGRVVPYVLPIHRQGRAQCSLPKSCEADGSGWSKIPRTGLSGELRCDYPSVCRKAELRQLPGQPSWRQMHLVALLAEQDLWTDTTRNLA